MIQVMIVDDETIVREGLKKIISKHTSEFNICAEASNGQEALDKIKQFCPNIVITDIKMPKMSGIDLIENINKDFPTIKHIILSGYSDFELIRQSFRNGTSDYLLKPIDSEELIDKLNKLKDLINKEKLEKFKNIEMDKLLTSSISFVMEHFFNDIIIKDKLNIDEINKFLKKYEVDFKFDFFEVLVIETDNFQKKFYKQPMKDNISLLNYAIKNLSQELIQNNELQTLIFTTKTNEVVAIIGHNEDSDVENIFDKTMKSAEDIREAVEKHLDHTVTIGVSRMGRGADKVWMSYQEAQLAVKHRMFQGNNKVIHANSIQSLEASTYSYHLNNEKSIISFIAIRDKEKSLKTLNDLFKEILKNNATPVHVYEVCDDILTRILLYLKEIDADLPLQFEQQVLKNRESSLYEDIEQLKKWLYSVICSAIDMLNNSNNSNSNRIILEAQRFVINNYFNHISLNTIAEYLNISPQYFSELFKKETGENFIKYLTNVRMEKAKELLNEPGIKTYEVSELVSYDNPTYFNKVFKKIVGVSPQRYRNLQFKKE